MPGHPPDACLEVIAHRHRRHVIRHLRHGAGDATTLEELIDCLHDSVSDYKNGPLPDQEELAIQLRHTHLPTLAEHGLIEFDLRSGTIRYHPDEQVETVLDSLPREVALPNY